MQLFFHMDIAVHPRTPLAMSLMTILIPISCLPNSLDGRTSAINLTLTAKRLHPMKQWRPD